MDTRRELNIAGTTHAAAMRAMGPFFLEELKQDAEAVDCPPAVKRDWFIIADWLGHSGGELEETQRIKIAQAWSAYMAIGVGPSAKLQPIFSEVSSELKRGSKLDRPPTDVMNVFDRLLASDAEIKAKRDADIANEKLRLQKAMQGNPRKTTGNISGRYNRIKYRKLIFVSIVWIAIVFLYAWLFDPFDIGGWDQLDDAEMNRLFVISLLPPIAYAVFSAYQKWVR
jgi:hypothetical protein